MASNHPRYANWGVPVGPECDDIIHGSPYSPNGVNQYRPCYFTPKFKAVFTAGGAEHTHFVCGVHVRKYRKFSVVTPLGNE